MKRKTVLFVCLLASCLQNHAEKILMPEDTYTAQRKNTHFLANNILGIICATLSTEWLLIGFMPYGMAISDSPHVTTLEKAVATTIYLGVPLCGYMLSFRLLEW